MKIYFLPLILSLTVAAPPPLFVAAQTRSGPSTNSSNNTYYDLNSTAPLIFIVFVAAAFFTGFIAIFMRRYCHFDTVDGVLPLHVATAAAATSRQRPLSPTGLDPAVINALPILKYSEIKHLKIGEGELSCAVCVSEFENDQRLRLLPKCEHVFHPECIDLWLASHSTCPICRANLSQGIKPTTQSTADCNSRREARNLQNQNQISITVDEVETATRERVRMFPRPHSTGHSLVQLGEDCERYTPEEAGRHVDRLDRGWTSGKWFCMTPPFFTGTGSLRPAKMRATDDEVMAVGTS